MEWVFITRAESWHVSQIACLYREVGSWTVEDEQDPQLVDRIVNGSHCFAVVLEGKYLIGMGRAISDNVHDAYIQDVVVREEWRRRGIGTAIVKKLIERLEADGLRWVGLISTSQAKDLYIKLGFKEIGCNPMMLAFSKDK